MKRSTSSISKRWYQNSISFFVGLIFTFGLGISGMTQPDVVKGFLNFFSFLGHWNPRLLGVMMGAIAIHALAYQFIKRRSSPILSDRFQLPTKKDFDLKLFFGAAIFGLGWGWAGICPGPAIVSLPTGQIEIFIFVGSMVIGMYFFKWMQRRNFFMK